MTASLISLPPMLTTEGLFVPDVELTIRQAAALCACTIQTLRRRLAAGRLPNAHLEGVPGDSKWLIPVRDLVTAGLLAAGQVAADGAVPDLTGAQQGHLQHLVEENRRLAETVTELRRDVAFLRSLLTEKGQAA